MTWFWDLNLIHFFNFYLGLAFLASCYMRVTQYRAILGLAGSMPKRWPKLFGLIHQHRHIFLTWATVLPAVLALVLLLLNMLATRFLLSGDPEHYLTPAKLLEHWVSLPVVLICGAGMLAVDWYCTFTVGEVDREMMHKYFDQAEYWLRPWAAPLVSIFTLGYVNPRQMVHTEVQKALLMASEMINSSLWWVITQVGVRIAFGLSLWLTYAWSRA